MRKRRPSFVSRMPSLLSPSFNHSPGFIDSHDTKLTITLSSYQGNRVYIPQNVQGPLPPPTDKKETPKEPYVPLVPFTRLHFSEAFLVRSFLPLSSEFLSVP